MSGGRPNVKQAEDGSGAERRNGEAKSEVRNAQWDMLRREAHGGIIQRDGLTDGHTGCGKVARRAQRSARCALGNHSET